MPNPIGVNTWTWISPFTTADAAILFPKVKEMGFDIVEIPLEDPTLADGPTVAEALKANGLSATVCGAFGPSRDLTSEDPANIQGSLDYILAAVKFTQEVGATVLAGPMYSAVGKARQVPPDVKKREFDMAVAGLKKAGVMAADHGVTLAIEPLNRFETDLINTARQAKDLIQAIDSPNVKIHLDTFHMNIEEESVYDAIVIAGADLAHVHASESNRGTPGSALAAWEDLARGIKAVNYTGPVVIETFTPDVKEIARAAAIWRPLAVTQDDLAYQGLVFLRALLN